MALYVLKNEHGTQSVSKQVNDSDKIVGVWKLKTVNSKFIRELVSEIEYKGDTRFEKSYKLHLTYSLVDALNNILKKTNVKKAQDKLYGAVINYMKSVSRVNDSISIASILKNFEQTDTPIDKQVLLDMVKDRLLYKSYQKVCISKKGFGYVK